MGSRADKWVQWTLDFLAKNWKLCLGIMALSTITSLVIKPPQLPQADMTQGCSCTMVIRSIELVQTTLEMCLDHEADRPESER